MAPARSITVALTNDEVDLVSVALLDWITVPYILAGLVAWLRRPDSRLGPLMITGGFVSGLSALQLTHVEALFTIGALFDVLPAALFLHVVLAFPDGRLRSSFERALVVAAYAAAIGLQLVKLRLVIPPIDCQRALKAIPGEMAPYMVGYKMRGKFDTDIHVDIDWNDLDATQLDGHIGIKGCKVLDEPEDSPKRLE